MNINDIDDKIISEVYSEIQKRSSASNKGSRVAIDEKKAMLENAKFKKKLHKVNSKKLGFTNKLAVCLVIIMVASLMMGFYLAIKSIEMQYTGALVCWSCVIAPLDTCLGIVLVKVVDKSKAENLGPDGTGISFAAAQAANFTNNIASIDSPAI